MANKNQLLFLQEILLEPQEEFYLSTSKNNNNNNNQELVIEEIINIPTPAPSPIPTVTTQRKLQPFELFRRKARVVRILCAVGLAFSQCAREAGVETHGIDSSAVLQGQTRAQFYSEKDGFLEFDMSDFTFRTDNEYRWPKYAKDAVLTVPAFRSEADIKLILSLMNQMKIFYRQEPTVQEKIAAHSYYMKLDKNRDVLRVGHQGYSYYFIFSGEVKVHFGNQDTEPMYLRKGEGFGERSILFECDRNATVTTTCLSEFLIIYDTGFLESGFGDFYTQQFQKIETFLRSLTIFSSLTTDVLHTLARNCFMSDYLDGNVIVKDSKISESVWFIYKGAADVFRHLHKKKKKIESATKEKKQLWLAETDGKLPKMSPSDRQNQTSDKTYKNFISQLFQEDSMMKVNHLSTGNSFGISSVYDKTRSFILISRGAEVISLSKKCLLEYVTPAHLEMTLGMYEKLPSDKVLAKSCVQETGWVLYRRKEMKSTLHKLQDLSKRFEKTQGLFNSQLENLTKRERRSSRQEKS